VRTIPTVPVRIVVERGPNGAIFDWGLDRAVATTIALADGTASICWRTGGGVIGAGFHEPPAFHTAQALITAIRRATPPQPPESADGG